MLSSLVISQEIVPRYWNSLSTHVTVGVPLVDDESLIGGRIQVRVNFDEGNTFTDLGQIHIIEKGDIDDVKQVSIPAKAFENMSGFQENAKVQFIAQLWDRAGNSVTGPVSDSILTIDENIPEIVSRVAIVTSPLGAAIRDVLSTLNRRAPHVEAIVVASKVQGEGSAASIKKALERVNVFSEQNAVDAVIVCRGGGSIEDLWSFNDEELCRYMAHYPLPVISGVGHETDFTLVDFVANTRAATPTAAAEIITEGASKLNDYFLYLKERLQKESTSYLRNLKEKIHNLSRLLKSPKQRLEDQYQKLDMISERLLIGMKLKISNKNANYSLVSAKLDALSPSQKIAVAKDKIRNAQNNLLEKIRMRLKNLENRILIQYEKISALNPNEILKRGYSITFDQDGTIIDDPSKLSKGDVLDTQLAKGKFKSQVID